MKEPHVVSGGGDDGMESTATPSNLLDRLRKPDDSAAWERLWVMFGPTVEGWCRRAGLTAEDADDVRQEVFRAVAHGITGFRRDRPGDSFRGWLYATTRRRMLDHWRHRNRQPQGEGGTDHHVRLLDLAEEEPTETGELTHDVRGVYERCIRLIKAEFEDRTWQAFWQVTVDGKAAADVAAELGMTPGAVYIAKSRVLKRLRAEFSDLL